MQYTTQTTKLLEMKKINTLIKITEILVYTMTFSFSRLTDLKAVISI